MVFAILQNLALSIPTIFWLPTENHVYKSGNLYYAFLTIVVATLTLGLRPRQGVARLWAKRKTWESHHMFPGVPKSVREWIVTFPSELQCWELESQMDSQTFIV
jgi:hypothetical protein